MSDPIRQKMTEKMEGAIEHLRKELAGIRTGRASLALLDGIMVDSYGSVMPLRQVATLSVPESRVITIQPWDNSLVPSIEKAILASDLGLTPSHDGKVLRISIPPLTEERRKDLVRIVKKVGEEAKVIIRNHRRDANEEMKKQEKTAGLSKDDIKKAQDEVQKATDRFVKKVDETLQHKEVEILER
jgi:ribosome recycling factor